MEDKLKKKYGLFTAISMVAGIVIGSGVFYKAQSVLSLTEGDMPLGIIAWLLGGIIMLLCVYSFATLSGKYDKVNGIVDYAEATVGRGYAKLMGWFTSIILYPTLISVLAWLSARYSLELFGFKDSAGGLAFSLACLYLVSSFLLNSFAPVISGKFQVSATVVKLIPLVFMGIIGTIVGLSNGNTVSSFSTLGQGDATSLFGAVVATAFAYEGWITATSINAELRDSKRNLPKALIFGSIIVIVAYIVYYIGVAGSATVEEIINEGTTVAYKHIFGNFGGTILKAFVVVSCLGTLNGLMLGCSRGIYSLAVRNEGPAPKVFSQLDRKTNTPINSAIIALFTSALWMFYYRGANLGDNIFGIFGFDSSELPIVTCYALYIPIFAAFIIKSDKKNILKNKIMPALAIAASLFMIVAAVYAHGVEPYIAAKNDKIAKEYSASVSAKDDIFIIFGKDGKITAESGAFKFEEIEYIVDENGVRLIFDKRIEKLSFFDKKGKELFSTDKIESNEVYFEYNSFESRFEDAEFNENHYIDINSGLTVKASFEKENSHFSCPIIFYLIVFVAIMALGWALPFNKKID